MKCIKLLASIIIALGLLFGPTVRPARAQSPSWLSSSVIYCVDDEIFSTDGISGVTAQLSRLQSLGVNTIWLMPIYPRGQAVTVDGISHPSYNSPYCINNFEAVDPNYGTSAELTTLISTAHGLGMKVILDAAINCTSWDNPLVTSTPQYYLHSDGNPDNVASIEEGWGTDADVAQLNLTTNEYGAQTYVTDVCEYWVQNYDIDGFRFDSADDPSGTTRSLPQSLAESIISACRTINSNIMDLGEEEDVSLALEPYDLDYGWNMWFYGVVPAFTTSGDESTLSYQWDYPYTISNTSPAGMLHMNIQDDWDLANRDNITLGGYAQAMAAACWNFTISGVPLVYNGMEVANTNGGENSHTQIDWTGTDSAAFTTFYTQLIALRNNSGGALQQGTTTFETDSSSAVISYDRTGGGQEYFIEINTNGSSVSGTVSSPSGATWTDVTPTGSPGGTSHEAPSTGDFSLQPYDFAIFKRNSSTPTVATPTFSPAPGTYTGSQSVTISDSTSGSTIYYTTNGTTPTTSSTKYTGAISVTSTETIEAMAAESGYNNSAVASGAYTINSGTGGSLTGAVTSVTSAQAFNLTTLGYSDWAAWGFDGTDRDSSGGSQIGALSAYSSGSLNTFTSSFLGMTWTNGTPDASETDETDGYYNNAGVGDGFTFTAPASTTSQTLTVFVGGWETGGTLTATLSDGSATAYSNSSLTNTSASYYGYYTLTYHAASAGQKLTIVWKQASGSGNVTIYSAALAGASLPTAATPTFSPAPGTYTSSQSVTLSDTTSGATIYYTTNGTTPTTSSAKYTGAISVTSTETIEAMAAASGYNNSSVASGTYTINTGSGGSLSGAVTTITSSQASNLTSIGTTDWGEWGWYGTWTHDSSGGSKISNVSTYGGGSLNSFSSGYLGFTWTNGTPYASETDETDGYYNGGGVGDGFTLTAPASTSVQHLTVYVGGYETSGTLTATLSDGSAGPYTNSSLSSTTGSYYGYYTLTYNAASAGKTLTVVWKEASEVSGGSNLTIYAAALH